MSVPHFSLSFAMSAAYSSGDDGSGSPPSAAMRALTSGVSMPARSTTLSLSMMAFGVPAGASRP